MKIDLKTILNYLLKIAIVFGLFILSQVSMTVFSVFKLISVDNQQASLSTASSVVVLLLTLGLIILLVWLATKLKIITLDFEWSTVSNWGIIALSFILGRIVAFLGTLLIQLTSGSATSTNDAAIDNIISGEQPWLIFLIIAIAPAIMEEIVFRGGIIGFIFEEHPVVGLIISSAIFGYLHSATTIFEFILYFSLGFIMGFSYYKTKRLEVSIMVHFLNNGLAVLAMFLLQS
ncbi:membrane protease YdiL (CAAX protease family) [Enterococcus sp. PF1-24]|uniref:CPBP family intramembrane glutamic endopeptidase n=1 Tax=unclassified Enterococcus TaxID=2608891 RepID=UPI0024741258|nr:MULTISPECIES: CPBP family intramembrane glutamic endopeptidase [unclassified Enterococcus]MDH6365543.1 membrane protease YdiL (CAAX protease family) [Enterococcus sp. PFB1-1]MDH6402644.1 membrane protease YdiL (CAAX protease family) [Enterococcus sp. PF1-24]